MKIYKLIFLAAACLVAAPLNAQQIQRTPITFGKDVLLNTNESAEMVVVIGANATVHGEVLKDVIVIGGDVQFDGSARDVVAVLGGVKLGPGAKILRDVVAIGGGLDRAVDVEVGRRPVELDLGKFGFGIRQWVLDGLFKLRPFAPRAAWGWFVALFFFLIYLVIALVMPGAVRTCASELGRRPTTTFFMGLLTVMLIPFLFFILAATGIGAFIIPFIMAALVFGLFLGKTALFEALGVGIGKRFGAGVLQNPLLAFVTGFGVITILYMVPLVGFLTLAVIGLWGLGGAVTAAFGTLKRETPSVPRSSGPATSSAEGSPSAAEVFPAVPPMPANSPEASSHRRANFWERMGAGFLDLVIVGMLSSFAGPALRHFGPPVVFLIALAYFAAMWAWKGTTFGGVVLGLRVVRFDGQPVTFVVALVRALAAAVSIMVFFLGFLWIIWDREKQAWHDKIAGTVVIHSPRTAPLVCL